MFIETLKILEKKLSPQMDEFSLLIPQNDNLPTLEYSTPFGDACGFREEDESYFFDEDDSTESIDENFSLHSRSSSSSSTVSSRQYFSADDNSPVEEISSFNFEKSKLPSLSNYLSTSVDISGYDKSDDQLWNACGYLAPIHAKFGCLDTSAVGWNLDSYELGLKNYTGLSSNVDIQECSVVEVGSIHRAGYDADMLADLGVQEHLQESSNDQTKYSNSSREKSGLQKNDKRRKRNVKSKVVVRKLRKKRNSLTGKASPPPVKVVRTTESFMVSIRYVPLIYFCCKKKEKSPKRYKVTAVIDKSHVNITELRSMTEMKLDLSYQLLDHEQAKSNLLSLTEKMKDKKLYYSRVNINELAVLLGLQHYKIELTAEIEINILRIFKDWCGYALGYCSWVRDTKERERTEYIDKLYSFTKICYPELDRSHIEIIIKRGTYNVMQSRLRKDRRRM